MGTLSRGGMGFSSMKASLAPIHLGYFLERWGTQTELWTYYTRQTPPLFAVLAHGMAAVAFWRVGLLIRQLGGKLLNGKPTEQLNHPSIVHIETLC